MGVVLTVGECLGVLRPATGPSLASASAVISTGGAEGNVAIGLARLGVPARWSGRIGNDGLGELIRRNLSANDVDTHAFIDDEAPTAFLTKESPEPGRTAVSYYRAGCAGSRLSPVDTGTISLEDVDLVHVTGITPALSSEAEEAIFLLVDRARARQIPVSFDLNHRGKLWGTRSPVQTYRHLAERADILFASDDEAALITAGTVADMAEELSSWGIGEVVLKLGADGAYALAGDVRLRQTAVAVDVVDTVGAGDAFIAGYLAERLRGADLAARLRLAVACGAAACRVAGDWEGAPTRAEAAAVEALGAGRTTQRQPGGDPVSR